MKTTYTSMAILALVLFAQTAAAKLGANNSTLQFENNVGINVEAEITNNINEMLASIEASNIKGDVTKQLNIDTVQAQANQLVQNVNEQLPAFKFKVVIAD